MNRFILRRLVHLDARARQLEERDLHQQAASLREEVCELGGDHLGGDHPWRVSRLFELAASYRRSGELARAEALYRDVIRRLSARGDDGDHLHDLARALNSLGVLYCETDRHQRAIGSFERGLAISRDRLVGSDDPGLAAILQNLGSAHHALEHHRRAEICYLEALAIHQRLGDATLLEQAHGRCDLAELAADRGRLDVSDSQAGKASTLYRNALQRRDTHLAESLIRLAHLYRRIGRPGRAAELFEEAAEILQRAGNVHERDLAHCLDQLSELHRLDDDRC